MKSSPTDESAKLGIRLTSISPINKDNDIGISAITSHKQDINCNGQHHMHCDTKPVDGNQGEDFETQWMLVLV
jgi:hypothetical protein